MHKVHGNLLGLKPSHKQRLEKLYQRRVHPDQIVSPELARTICEISREISRQVGLFLDRRGRVQDVFVGDARQITLTGLGRYRAGKTRLRGLRFVHTHLQGEPLSQDDLTDLALLRFDAIVALEATEQGLPGKVYWAHLKPGHDPQDPCQSEASSSLHQLPQDFDHFIDGLERELADHWEKSHEHGGKRQALLVGVTTSSLDRLKRNLDELRNLAESADLEVVEVVTQRRQQLDPRYVVGSGKLKDLYVQCMQQGVDLLIFDGELSSSQVRAISEFGELEVWDRTQLILNIFARRAHSGAGKVQVELAMLKYTLPRLVLKDNFLSRLTGGIGARGPGETKMEVWQRRIRDRINRLEKELDELSRQRKLRRDRRQKNDLPIVSIVGYTNAGKSTLLNRLTHSQVLAEQRMFATLETTTRRLRLPSGRFVLLTDTVGFIRDLPEDLAKAFRATLEELSGADLLVHLLDASDPEHGRQLEAVEQILGDLAIDNLPQLVVLNKIDRLSPEEQDELRQQGRFLISALDGSGLDELLNSIESELAAAEENAP
ncbi:MAG: GTPase HflX [Candidatus Eremiobacteraeota bacterium]|nr:GTPase HflX [Candidatus Eremiobacteraeota bacterium]MCW5869960.1 GTPase HflX [Candidatus Eremiobacteraeota bacterium]